MKEVASLLSKEAARVIDVSGALAGLSMETYRRARDQFTLVVMPLPPESERAAGDALPPGARTMYVTGVSARTR